MFCHDSPTDFQNLMRSSGKGRNIFTILVAPGLRSEKEAP